MKLRSASEIWWYGVSLLKHDQIKQSEWCMTKESSSAITHLFSNYKRKSNEDVTCHSDYAWGTNFFSLVAKCCTTQQKGIVTAWTIQRHSNFNWIRNIKSAAGLLCITENKKEKRTLDMDMPNMPYLYKRKRSSS